MWSPHNAEDALRTYVREIPVPNVAKASEEVFSATINASAAALLARRHRRSFLVYFLRYCTTVVTTESDYVDAFMLAVVTALPSTVVLITLTNLTLLPVLAACSIFIALYYIIFFTVLKNDQNESDNNRSIIRRAQWINYFRDQRLLSNNHRELEYVLQHKKGFRLQVHKEYERYTNIISLLRVNLWDLSGREFEIYLSQVFIVHGYPLVHVTPQSGDFGVDLVVGDGRHRIAIQAKLWLQDVGCSAVEEVLRGMRYYGCNRCVVVTNSRFAKTAIDLAHRHNCKLVDGERLLRIIAGKEFI